MLHTDGSHLESGCHVASLSVTSENLHRNSYWSEHIS